MRTIIRNTVALAAFVGLGTVSSLSAAAAPALSVSVSIAPLGAGDSITLPDSKVGSEPIPMAITIRNAGDAELDLTGYPPVTLSGDGMKAFAIAQQPLRTLEAGGSSSFTILFRPPARGTYDAIVTISSTDPKSPAFSFYISATGTE